MTYGQGPDNPLPGSLPHASAPKPAPNTTLYLVLSILLIVPLCNVLFGVLSLVFTTLSRKAFENNDPAEGESKLRIAKILLIVGFILTVLSVPAWMAFVSAANDTVINTTLTTTTLMYENN